MIAQQEAHPAARLLRLALQLIEQPEDARDVHAAIHHVADHHEMPIGKGPMVGTVDDAEFAQEHLEAVEIAVRIAHHKGLRSLVTEG